MIRARARNSRRRRTITNQGSTTKGNPHTATTSRGVVTSGGSATHLEVSTRLGSWGAKVTHRGQPEGGDPDDLPASRHGEHGGQSLPPGPLPLRGQGPRGLRRRRPVSPPLPLPLSLLRHKARPSAELPRPPPQEHQLHRDEQPSGDRPCRGGGRLHVVSHPGELPTGRVDHDDGRVAGLDVVGAGRQAAGLDPADLAGVAVLPDQLAGARPVVPGLISPKPATTAGVRTPCRSRNVSAIAGPTKSMKARPKMATKVPGPAPA